MTDASHRVAWIGLLLWAAFFAGCAKHTTLAPLSDTTRDAQRVEDSIAALDTAKDKNLDLSGDNERAVSVDCLPANTPLPKCTDDEDCASGWCVLHRGEMVCTHGCVEECLVGWSCEQVGSEGGTPVYVCVSLHPSLCLPCEGTLDCSGNERCVWYEGNMVAFCGTPCQNPSDCPCGYQCSPLVTSEGDEKQVCVNSVLVCECTDYAVSSQLLAACSSSSEAGTCYGVRTCTTDGLSECSALQPMKEVCDGEDNDCDGVVDDGKVCESCQCGDGVCNMSGCGECWEKDCMTCAVDCALCGNGLCDPGEGPAKCALDCCGSCTDGVCKGGECHEDDPEHEKHCPEDCDFPCGNGDCEGGETPDNCPDDCEMNACGNGACEPGEGPGECPDDCSEACGDCICGGAESFVTCPVDCGYCGDGYCIDKCAHIPENMSLCPLDCACVPDCEGKECGDDGCGGSCGGCWDGNSCTQDLCLQSGDCTYPDEPTGTPCTSEGLCFGGCQEGSCVEAANEVCDGEDNDCDQLTDEGFPDFDEDGKADCVDEDDDNDGHADEDDCEPLESGVPSCEGKECGDDGCGDECGKCVEAAACHQGLCVLCPNGACDPEETCCTCADDCGQCCGNGQCDCDEDVCACSQDCGSPCDGKDCGPDGCGGSCGECHLDVRVLLAGYDLDLGEMTANEASFLEVAVEFRAVDTGEVTWVADSLVQSNGWVQLNLSDLPLGDYHVVVGHVNHVDAMAAEPVSHTGQDCPVLDFSSEQAVWSAACFAAPPVMCEAGVCLLWPGELNGDAVVDSADMQTLSAAIEDGEGGYAPALDANGDGSLDGLDSELIGKSGMKRAASHVPGDVSCPACGDGTCGPGEDCADCPGDCAGCCPDSFCGADETCSFCWADCGCSQQEVCYLDLCCAPACEGLECGDDGCGGVCGSCDDSSVCTSDECVEGLCQNALVLECDDGNTCTDDTCDPTIGCVVSPVDDSTPCADDDICDGEEVCLAGECVAGQPVDCSGIDGACLLPECNPETGLCDLPADDGLACDDGNGCTLDDSCVAGECSGVACEGMDLMCVAEECVQMPCGALQFDGLDDLVTVAPTELFEFEEAYTIEFWMRWQPTLAGKEWQYLVQMGLEDDDEWWALFRLESSMARLHFISNGALSDGDYVYLPLDEWVHVAGVYEDGLATIYVNGALDDVDAELPLAYGTAGALPMAIGGLYGQPEDYPFEGKVASVRVSDVARYNMDEDFVPPKKFIGDENTVALWTFAEPSMGVVEDGSGNGLDASVLGPGWVSDAPPQYCCVTKCDNNECGDDACGGQCGECGEDYYCKDGACTMKWWIDPTTGLWWETPPQGGSLNWVDSDEYCGNLELGGHEDWRLPTITELRSLVRGCASTELEGPCPAEHGVCQDVACQYGCGCSKKLGGPAEDGCYWPGELDANCWYYTSSSLVTDWAGNALRVDFRYASVNAYGKSYAQLFMCVR